jgi:hypothetical protein
LRTAGVRKGSHPALRCLGARGPGKGTCCWLGTVLSSERGAEREYHELYVRAETGVGAEAASVH